MFFVANTAQTIRQYHPPPVSLYNCPDPVLVDYGVVGIVDLALVSTVTFCGAFRIATYIENV